MRWILPIVILLVGVAGFAGLRASRPGSSPLQGEEKTWIVSVEVVTPATMAPTLTLYGRVGSPRMSRLSAAVTADVKAVWVLEGEQVSDGQRLISLDDRESVLLKRQREADAAEIRAQIESEKTRYRNDQSALEQERRLLELSRKALGRARDLARTNVGSQSQLDNAMRDEARQILALDTREMAIREFRSRLAQYNARLARAEALRDRADLDLARAEIDAPFAGRIAEVFIAPGDRVRAGDELVRLYDISAIELQAQIPIRYLPAVRASLHDHVALRASAEVDRLRIEAVLDRLTAEVQPGSGGINGIFKVIAGADWLQVGRTVEVIMTLPPRDDVVALPLEAVYGIDRIFKLTDDRMTSLQIERIGELRTPSGETRVLVASPHLHAGDRVVITQLPNATDGLKVRTAEGS